jgi:3-isopropylmalate dehydrogenase
VPGGEHAHDILLATRRKWDLYANVRPVRALTDELVPLKGKTKADVNLLIYRENTEGEYFGAWRERGRGSDRELSLGRELHTRRGVERLLRAALTQAQELAVGLTLTDKSNAIPAQRIWRRVAAELAPEFPDVPLRALYVDALAAELVLTPERHRVIACTNLQGDILADLAAALAGGLGLAPSQNLHPAQAGHIGLFEPVHGSAPDLAGRDVANPLGAIRSLGLLLAHLGHRAEAEAIERSAAEVVRSGRTTPDAGGSLGTTAACSAFLDVLAGQ